MSQAKISLDLNCIAGFSLLHIGRTDDIVSASLITFCTGFTGASGLCDFEKIASALCSSAEELC